ncbi:alpha/beta fold hydrolase [Pseudoduganella ginsengisoli]|uniref:Alpha/beta fold hydrolase n=1 Tax=Pseudoduganella ginsengisoli TaxID=1462440 RepID=A0A6L6Q4M5_9BURK|nr:alpha/beta fold hydrolase [Pseudoduganella ginsengisoli]MTW04793.1 alpha/beta fold hydrolase [Pseudoduganella ginsengisoli]
MRKLAGGLLAMAAISTVSPAWAEDAQGHWHGTIAGTLAVVLDVSKTPAGVWEATLHSPSQAFSTKVSQFASDAAHLSFAIPKLGASYQAVWNDKDKVWAGTWTQGQQAPLNLTRTDAGAAAALQPRRPQETAIAAASAPYTSDEVQFGHAQWQLAGSLFVPKGAGPWPAVVLVHGSGPNNRDEDIFGHKIFLVLADHLARNGIAVLRYDKRGVGGSNGDYDTATTLDFAFDAQAAVAYLRTRPDINARHIGMIGHSEGGLIAPMVAARDPQLGFVVLMAGPGVRGDVLMAEQMARNAELDGLPPEAAARQRIANRALFAAIMAEHDPQRARSKATAMLEQGERDGLYVPGTAAMTAKSLTSPWFHTFLTLDPGVALKAMRQPVLALNGELDWQVPSRLDLDAMRAALANNPRAVVKELPRLNHLFQTATTGSGQEYAQIEETLAPSALEAITGWIQGQVR